MFDYTALDLQRTRADELLHSHPVRRHVTQNVVIEKSGITEHVNAARHTTRVHGMCRCRRDETRNSCKPFGYADDFNVALGSSPATHLDAHCTVHALGVRRGEHRQTRRQSIAPCGRHSCTDPLCFGKCAGKNDGFG